MTRVGLYPGSFDPIHNGHLDIIGRAAAERGLKWREMVSGAGHDAMVMAGRMPTAMLFLRSPGGISHHPDESVLVEDVQAALDAGLYFLKHLDAEAIVSSKTPG